MRLALAARIFSPRVELFRSLAAASPAAASVPSGACCWAEVSGQAFTDAPALSAALSSPERLAGGARAAAPTAVPRTPCPPPFPTLNASFPSNSSRRTPRRPPTHAGASDRVYSFDHVYRAAPGAPAAVLYGSLGSPCTHALHGVLRDAAGARTQRTRSLTPTPIRTLPEAPFRPGAE